MKNFIVILSLIFFFAPVTRAASFDVLLSESEKISCSSETFASTPDESTVFSQVYEKFKIEVTCNHGETTRIYSYKGSEISRTKFYALYEDYKKNGPSCLRAQEKEYSIRGITYKIVCEEADMHGQYFINNIGTTYALFVASMRGDTTQAQNTKSPITVSSPNQTVSSTSTLTTSNKVANSVSSDAPVSVQKNNLATSTVTVQGAGAYQNTHTTTSTKEVIDIHHSPIDIVRSLTTDITKDLPVQIEVSDIVNKVVISNEALDGYKPIVERSLETQIASVAGSDDSFFIELLRTARIIMRYIVNITASLFMNMQSLM